MPIDIKMPALSPTMEQGTLARWLVKEGDEVSAGDILAEIETDKATMEFEAVDEGTILSIVVPEGSEDVKVGAVIATMAGEDEDTSTPASAPDAKTTPVAKPETASPPPAAKPVSKPQTTRPDTTTDGDRIIASPLAKRIAEQRGLELSAIKGSGPNGRIVKADVEAFEADAPTSTAKPPQATSESLPDSGTPFEDVKLSSIRKVIARRLTESKQQIPHIYLTVDVRLDALLKLRAELNDALAARDIKLSVNDMLIKALGVALMQVPACNVSFAGDVMRQYKRADVSVAVSIPGGLITPIVTDASQKGLARISSEMSELAGRAKEGKLQPHEYQGGTASLSNMGMMGIKQFEAVINPPQAMIMAIGAGERRPWVMEDDQIGVATVMSATGSFDHRAIDGADGAQLMAVFRELIEKPLGLVA
ncbi:pyruvate dehydrogenase complex dihydrolipoamide acetyltransferase [Croceicoccus estronivorus]|uniref:pyruvate dehydrogenase complex dihydrolipoamide acetyltransferase n=1 Tax=Croceicoccus estronivorus TaxID=1172626 RepID=UPI000831945D|nr:pyruvate dehydrogenase complex dihydrolipoamide acetyltransferase [Croceicoccus estronivorus]OCC24536.1 pyruvate dehydrogenase complex dihydrolipoamide acetyltransferase [Croceicoccus estronivorus]